MIGLPSAEDALEQTREARLEVRSAQFAVALAALHALAQHAGLAQHLEVVAGGGLAHGQTKRAAGLGRAGLVQLPHDLEPDGVAERRENRFEAHCLGWRL